MQETHDVASVVVGKRMGGVEIVAKKYASGKRSVLRWADAGLIPFGVKLGGRRLWDLDEIDTHIANGCPRIVPTKRGAK